MARPAWSGEEVDPEEDEAHSVMHGDSLDYYREFGMHKEIFQGLDERILHPDPDSLHHYFQNLDNVTVQEVAIRLSGLGLSTDEFFLMTMSIIIFFMQAGFAFLEAGSVRSKNTTNILIKNLLDCLIGSLAYWLIGFPLAFGHSGNGFMGWTYWASSGLPEHEFGHWFFDFVHAATAATLVSGSLAERCNFWAYLAYSFIITEVVENKQNPVLS
ncbi:unnamed protein product [Darwinula stevensoni]|uniref:Ammonium transporter AmtB-like domain-containing protein n=1 Tax=Darwinula stevensoni TaxID=69355 RepID=A0A7R8X0F5_9CRUS|nr:unnamed protein product [Darwinula stevensoni]CAG0881170.1 unnamed protein product [Darwinula stevensoni]